MASRRSRIKGIANIPQRRKLNAVDEDITGDVPTSPQDKGNSESNDESLHANMTESQSEENGESKIHEENNIVESEQNVKKFQKNYVYNETAGNLPGLNEKPFPKRVSRVYKFIKQKPSIISSRQTQIPDKHEPDNISEDVPHTEFQTDEGKELTDNECIAENKQTSVAPSRQIFADNCGETLLLADSSAVYEGNSTRKDAAHIPQHEIEVINKNILPITEEVQIDKTIANQKCTARHGSRLHRFIKPKPSIVTSRQNKVSSDGCKNDAIPNKKLEPKSDIGCVDKAEPLVDEPCIKEKTYVAPPKEVEYTLCETQLTQVNSSLTDSGCDKGARKIIPSLVSTTNADVEYPIPPASPNKINRARIKAVPKFDHRRTSFSASESEDESRRHRHRNDSADTNRQSEPQLRSNTEPNRSVHGLPALLKPARHFTE